MTCMLQICVTFYFSYRDRVLTVRGLRPDNRPIAQSVSFGKSDMALIMDVSRAEMVMGLSGGRGAAERDGGGDGGARQALGGAPVSA